MLIFMFVTLSGFTWVSGEAGEGVSGKLTLADVIGLSMIGWAASLAIFANHRKFYFPTIYRCFLPLLGVFFIGVSFSKQPVPGFLEVLVHAFIFVVSLALLNIVLIEGPKLSVERVLTYCLRGTSLLAAIGLLHFFFFPSWFAGSPGGLSGTFRNTGQAGSYFGLMLALVIPAFLSGLIRPNAKNLALAIIVLLALVFTFKRAALLGFLIGVGFLVVRLALSRSLRDKKLAVFLFVIGATGVPLAWGVFVWGLENVPGMAWRATTKMTSDGIDTWTDSFFIDNLRAALAAFAHSPIWGVGLANIQGVYTPKYEIHSTYFALLGTAGSLGVFAYLFFMGAFWFSVLRASRDRSPYGLYLSYFLPFLVGLQVSWGYTIHLRKREFWILLAVCVLCVLAVRAARERRPRLDNVRRPLEQSQMVSKLVVAPQ